VTFLARIVSRTSCRLLWTVNKCHSDSHLIFLCPRASRFWCISHWTHWIKLVSDAINCQACWWGSIKSFYPCCAYLLGIFRFSRLLQNPLSSVFKFPAVIHNTCKEKKIITVYLLLALSKGIMTTVPFKYTHDI